MWLMVKKGLKANAVAVGRLYNISGCRKGMRRSFNDMYIRKYPEVPFGTRVVDLRSDTLSTPSLEMRRQMFEAEVGDDVFGEDPTVNELERKSAEIFDKESAMFLPSATMSNLIAIMVHCDKRGSEIIVGSESHILLYEQAGAAQIGGVNIREVKNKADGTFDLQEVESKIRPEDIHQPRTSLICVENTHNVCGGRVVPTHWMEQLGVLAKSKRIPLHLDGARIFNAAIHLGVPVDKLVRNFDTVSYCLSKGLGSPIGSILVGPRDFIDRARNFRKVLGGGCRQVGIVAAAGVYALDNMVSRLSDDHRRTRRIADAIRELRSPLISVPPSQDIHTNILIIRLNRTDRLDADQLTIRLCQVSEEERSGEDCPTVVKIMALEKHLARLVLYCNISEEDIDHAVHKLRTVIGQLDSEYATDLRSDQHMNVSEING